MEAFHDSRQSDYRAPYGALMLGDSVELAFDVADAPGASVALRTWTDAEGECMYSMTPDGELPAEGGMPGAVRYRVTYQPASAGIVWYQFIIVDEFGNRCRFGAQAGQVGGPGQLLEWEPPSFQLTVCEPRDYPPAWHEPIDGYLHDPAACHDVANLVATLSENYPVGECESVLPWGLKPGPDAGLERGVTDAAGALERVQDGELSWFALNDDVFGFWRAGAGGSVSCVLLNASPEVAYDFPFPLVHDEVTDPITGYAVPVVTARDMPAPPFEVPVAERYALVHLYPFGTALLQFHARTRLQRPMQPGVGVLAHVTSVPAGEGTRPGTLGAPAHEFVDWLVDAGARYWQILPVNPTDEFGSPYAGISAFAGNALLLDQAGGADSADGGEAEYREFCQRQADWLEPYACFMAIRGQVGQGIAWQDWPERYRRFDAELVAADPDLAERAEACRREQYAFQRQWDALRAHARQRGVQIIGDMPIYVSADSADVWAHPELFQLDDQGRPSLVAGCPPDHFAPEGQVWGNPVYDWDAARATGYAWWMRRLERAFDLYDVVRLDHFIGFSRYFAIPATSGRAAEGEYRLGPGYDFFQVAHERFGQLPLIAEDLGLITPGVRSLIDECGFPGMDILQFADGNDPLSGYHPRAGKIAYSGTHDNQTLLGYIRDRYPDLDELETLDDLLVKVAACPAPLCVIALQDLMGLGDEARMNVPGVAQGNWAWVADSAALDVAGRRLKALVAGR